MAEFPTGESGGKLGNTPDLGRVLDLISEEAVLLRKVGLGDNGGFNILGGESSAEFIGSFSELTLLSVDTLIGLVVCLGGNAFCCVTADM